jgi:SAM-dependent methyltransferase
MTRRADGSAGDVDYGSIGDGYASIRQPDPRIARWIEGALADARTVLNVGAGAGSYEPLDRTVTAVEPSATMRAQRPPHLVKAIDATSGDIPFADDTFDAAMASVTVHQWPDLEQGLSEMRRVATGAVVILTFDPQPPQHWWLIDYVPELFEIEAGRMPTLDRIRRGLGGTSEVSIVPIPVDCTDRFGQALFGRPEQFLDPAVRRAMSAWTFLEPGRVEGFEAALSADLASGEWDRRYGRFRSIPQFDGGLRLVVAHRSP